MIEIDNLSYSYPDGTSALENISLFISAGERVGIVGANGAGKSTLLLHLNGILNNNGASASRISVCGLAMEKKNLKAIRQKVGLVFQNPDDQLFCPTVFDDVAFGPRCCEVSEAEVERRVRESLEAVGMWEVAKKSAFHLSLGQKRRVSIATVLSMSPEILAFDEPTSNLDPKSRKDLHHLLARIGGTQIIVTHDLEFVRALCPRVVVLSRGRIVSDGRTEEIFSDHGLLERYELE